MKTESKPEGKTKLAKQKYPVLNHYSQNNENQRPIESIDHKGFLPKIGPSFLNISAYATKFRDSKFD